MNDEVSAILMESGITSASLGLRVSRRRTGPSRKVVATKSAAQPAHAAAVGEPRNCLVRTDGAQALPGFFRQAVEAVVIGRNGGIMIVGWVDDSGCPLDSVMVTSATWRMTFDAASLARVRRADVEDALGTGPIHLFGFVGLVTTLSHADAAETVSVEFRLANGGYAPAKDVPVRHIDASALRDLMLGYLAGADFLGNPSIEAIGALSGGIGSQLVALNRAITRDYVAGRHVERFGSVRRQPKASIVVILYGKTEFLFLQNALFSGLPGIEDYEFVYVCNSPDIAEPVLREARAGQLLYGMNQTVVLLTGNAGFGAANNVGVASALADRVLIVNPDVLPQQSDWATQHTTLIEQLPEALTRMFGLPLYYDDGSLMHGGMYFEIDSGVSLHAERIDKVRMVRVEHYGKGTPAGSDVYTRPRPVPAVTGAFISADRAWYERLGGFDEDFVFGHYEDADLCLRSLKAGTAVWLHDIKLWHLEGKGSTRRPHHEGGSLVNRWLFNDRWGATIAAGITGQHPTHALLQRERVDPVIRPRSAQMPALVQ